MVNVLNKLPSQWCGPVLHLAGALTTLSVVVIFYLGAYRPLNANEARCLERLDQLEMLLSTTAQAHQEYRQLKQSVGDLEKRVTETRDRLPEQSLETEFISMIRQTAEGAGVELTEHRLSSPERHATHSQTNVTVEGRGSYDSICRFLQQAEQLARITRVAKFELETMDNSDQYPFQATFVLYYGVQSNDKNERRAALSMRIRR